MLSNKKGMAMLLVISLILMLLVLGGAVLMISTGHFSTSYHQLSRARAFYAAEAAMQHALWTIRTGAGGFTLPGPGTTAPIPFPEEINRIPVGDIGIEVEEINAQGVYPVNITVDY